MKPERGFETALAAAELSTAPRTARKMGAALFCGSRLLSVGYNRYHSHPESDNQDFCRSLHCENVALLRRRHYDLPKGRMVLYVARQLANGTAACSRPCDNCLGLCKVAGVHSVMFYNEAGQMEELVL